MPVFDHYFWFWFCIVGIGFPVALLQFAVVGPRAAKPFIVSKNGTPEVRFLSRFPREFGREIVSISMQTIMCG